MKYWLPVVLALFLCSCGGKKPAPAPGTPGNPGSGQPTPGEPGGEKAKVELSGSWDLVAFVTDENASPDAAKVADLERQIEEIKAFLRVARLTQEGYQAKLAEIEALEKQIADLSGTRAPIEPAPTLKFGPGLRASGNASCNIWNSNRNEVDTPDGVDFGSIALTKRLCDPALNKQETRFVDALKAAVRCKNLGDELQLIAADNSYLKFIPSAPSRP